jgi:DAK2 domain fusion protein YloV
MTDSPPSSAHKLGGCNGHRFRHLLDGAVQLLSRRSIAINNLNVFPVPDGDTGTNLLLTMRAAILAADEVASPLVGPVASALAHGALMGARGNSGVILSQYLRGFARGIGDAADVDGLLLASALSVAAQAARAAVTNPVEGTMLTVASDAAGAARDAAGHGGSVEDVLDAAVAEARASVQRTPDLLPILRQADVVDAGGMGLATLLEGMKLAARGEPLPEVEETVAPVAARLEEATYGYCTQFLVHGARIDVGRVREQLAPLGDSLLVVGDDDVVRVHVHTFQPGRAIDLALAHGAVDRITIDNMQEQNAHAREFAAPSSETKATCGLVVVSVGSGFRDLFRSLGATVVPGGQTLNPSAEDLLRALRSTAACEYVLLPNNPNVLMTAKQAETMFDKPVAVVATRNLAEGVVAAVSFQSGLAAEQNRSNMDRMLAGARTAEVTTAVRAANLDGHEIQPGALLGLVDERIVVVGQELTDVSLRLLEQLGADEFEVITLYAGQDLSSEAGSELQARLSESYARQQVDLIRGGQPHYQLILACE